ncbi:hypothetical protein [Spongiactinospora sp. 9N601]|uniref:hypothetical protein n=1 Tax=Spongiactinospora sp. 9N601 TaxID=3375149 RepID=UPI0037ADA857
MLAPGGADWPIQPIDVRDVAAFALDAAERRLPGSFNLAAPIGSSTFGALLDVCREVTGTSAVLEWVPHDFLIRQGVREWTELPLWRPYPGTWRVDSASARAAGLRCRPLADTVVDTWEWLNRAGPVLDHERAAELGITPEREAAGHHRSRCPGVRRDRPRVPGCRGVSPRHPGLAGWTVRRTGSSRTRTWPETGIQYPAFVT